LVALGNILTYSYLLLEATCSYLLLLVGQNIRGHIPMDSRLAAGKVYLEQTAVQLEEQPKHL
jgi:hypothetical protein